MSFFTVLFRTLDFTCTFIFIFLFFTYSFVSDFTLSTLILFHLYILHFTFLLSRFTLTFTYANNPEERERYHSWYSWSGSPTGSDFNNRRLLAPKYSDPLHSKCSAPLYSWSGSLTGSDYFSLYISLCFRLNKLLTNLTSSCQHHLQYSNVCLFYICIFSNRLDWLKKQLFN